MMYSLRKPVGVYFFLLLSARSVSIHEREHLSFILFVSYSIIQLAVIVRLLVRNPCVHGLN